MAIAQDAFYIPEDIATGIATGIYRRIGSVVRYATGTNKGQIVKHLQPIDTESLKQAKGIGAKAIQLAKQNKKSSIIAASCTVAVAAGVLIYTKVKNRQPKVVVDFQTALRHYIGAIRNGNMDIDIINNLMEKLEHLKMHKNYEKISVQLTTEELGVLVGRIYDYTVKLANDNHVELTEDELQASCNNGSDTIINLRSCLKAQKRIFEKAA